MKTATELWRSCRAKLCGMMRSDRGSVSIEFVIVLPIMVLILLGFAETYMYMRAVSAVDRTAFTLANSIGQMGSVIQDETDTTDANSYGSIWNDAILLAAPYPLKASGMVRVTSICDLVTGTTCANMNTAMTVVTPKVHWTAYPSTWTNSKNTAMASRVSTASPMPTSWPFRAGDSAVIVEVFLSYNPFVMTSGLVSSLPGITSNLPASLPGQQIVYRRVYVRPRSGIAL